MTELDLLAATAPAPRTVSFSDAEREALLGSILATPGRPHHVLTRPRLAVLVATTAVAVLVVPLVGLPGTTPHANAAIDALRTTAGDAPADLVAPGQFRHLVTYLRSGTERSMAQSWIAADGRVWRWDTFVGAKEYFAFPPSTGFDTGNASPAFLASLPTSSSALGRYLRDHVSGSSSRDQAVFVAVGDMLRGGYAPPALRAAAVGVLEGLPHVTTSQAADDLGRPALEITYTEPGDGAVALFFDTSSSALLGEAEGPAFAYAYVEDTATAVPADVLAHTDTLNP